MAPEYETVGNPEYVGPDRTTFITVANPTLEELTAIPEGCDIIVAMPNGQLSEWYWATELRADFIKYVEEGGDMTGHLFIYVNPEIIKEGH